VQACHDLSEGGLAVALAEMSLAGRLGAKIEIGDWEIGRLGDWEILFSESNGRLLIEVTPDQKEAVEAHFAGQVFVRLGAVTDEKRLQIAKGPTTLVDLAVEQLVNTWKGKAA
jgi:phosphoribosylformylglycinamidine synthase